MADPINVLAPNNLGETLSNRGVGELVANQGLGVAEAQAANTQAISERGQMSNPEMFKDKTRIAKARQFGMKKDAVGF